MVLSETSVSRAEEAEGRQGKETPRLLEMAPPAQKSHPTLQSKASCRGPACLFHALLPPCFPGSPKGSEPVSDFADAHDAQSCTLAGRFLSGRNANFLDSVER